MKAAVYFGEHSLRISEVPIDSPKENEVIIKVKACGVCGTDLHIFSGAPGAFPVLPPRILGHEFSGVVAEVGKGVKRVKEGDRVCVDPNDMCGSCYFCRNGQANFCEDFSGYGTTADGGFAEFVKVREKVVYSIPDSISFEEAAMAEPISCCLNGIELLDVHPGDAALIIGAGPIGLIILQLVRNAGASNIIVSEPVPEKRALANRLGATLSIAPSELGQAVALVKNIPRVIECVGSIPTLEEAIRHAGNGATVLLFGLSDPEAELTIRPYEVFKKQLRITSSFINPYTYSHSIDILANKRIEVEPIITDRVPLDGILPVFTDSGYRKRGKIIVTM